MKFLKDIFTSRDNSTYSMSKNLAALGVVAMTFEFVKMASVDFQGYGTALGILIGALAAKSYTDKKE